MCLLTYSVQGDHDKCLNYQGKSEDSALGPEEMHAAGLQVLALRKGH